MLPYLIAGAIGFGIGKLFEEGGETFGRGGKAEKKYYWIKMDRSKIDEYIDYASRMMGMFEGEIYTQAPNKVAFDTENDMFAFTSMIDNHNNDNDFQEGDEGYIYYEELFNGEPRPNMFDKIIGNKYAGGGEADEKLISIARAIFNPNEDNGKIATSFGKKTFDGFVEMIKQNDAYDIYYNIWSENAEGKYIATTYGDKTYMGLLEMLKSAKNEDEYAGGGKTKLYDVVAYNKSTDYDNKINGKIIADSYTRKVDAIKTMQKFKNSYPFIEIKEYMGNDPYKYAGGGRVKGIKNRAEKLLEESISYRWVNTDMGSGWSFELESPSNRSVFNILEEHTYLDEFSPEDAGFEDWDDLSEEDKDYYYQEWKEEFYQGAFERFKEKCMKHLDDFIEYLQKDSDENFAGGGESFREKSISMKGGVEYYSVDYDDVNGQEYRDDTFNTQSKAKSFFDKMVKRGTTNEEVPLDNVQLIEVYMNGDYEVLDSKFFNKKYAGGGEAGEKGKLNATYIPKRNIKTLTTTYGNTIKGKDLLDGAYTTRKDIRQDPKMVRTMFEEEEFAEFKNGGGVYDNLPILAVRNYDADYFVNESGEIVDNGSIKRYAIEIQSVPSGDVIDYTSASSEKEASEMIEKINNTQKLYADGGLAKKRRRRANEQIGKTDRSVDKTRVAKPVGYRFTNSLASKLRKDQYAVPTEKQITKYLGKGIYKENRRNKSDRDRTAKL
jgi:hypothetical protein